MGTEVSFSQKILREGRVLELLKLEIESKRQLVLMIGQIYKKTSDLIVYRVYGYKSEAKLTVTVGDGSFASGTCHWQLRVTE